MTKAATGVPRKIPQQERSRRTWARILAAAARVLSEEGFAGTTTDRIALAARVSVGTLYQYFPNKESLLRQLALDHMESSLQRVAALVDAAPTTTGGEWLSAAIRAVVMEHAVDPGLHLTIVENLRHVPDVEELYLRREEQLCRAVAARLPGPNPGLAARIIVTSVESVTHRLVPSGAVNHEELIEQLTLMIARYVAALQTESSSG